MIIRLRGYEIYIPFGLKKKFKTLVKTFNFGLFSLNNSVNKGYKYEIQQSLSTAGGAGKNNEDNVWQQIQHLAKTKRTQQLEANPPKRQCRKPSGGRGGPRQNAGRKRSIPKVSQWIDESSSVF